MDEATRFWSKVDQSAGLFGCWPWIAYRDASGYGRFLIKRVNTNAHRVAYELLVGPIPTGLFIDHLCRNRACCNPAHMEPVTNVENILRGNTWSGRNLRKTVCIHGHDAFRAYRSGVKAGLRRRCMVCARASGRASYARARAAIRTEAVA